MLDNGYFAEIKEELAEAGYKSWSEEQRYMLSLGENMISPNPQIEVRKETQWKEVNVL